MAENIVATIADGCQSLLKSNPFPPIFASLFGLTQTVHSQILKTVLGKQASDFPPIFDTLVPQCNPTLAHTQYANPQCPWPLEAWVLVWKRFCKHRGSKMFITMRALEDVQGFQSPKPSNPEKLIISRHFEPFGGHYYVYYYHNIMGGKLLSAVRWWYVHIGLLRPIAN